MKWKKQAGRGGAVQRRSRSNIFVIDDDRIMLYYISYSFNGDL